MKKTKYFKSVLSLFVISCLLVSTLNQIDVYAQEQLPLTCYATPEQALSSFDTDINTSDKIDKKVIFGKDASGEALEWYIAGEDPVGGGLVLVSASPYETEQVFNEESPNLPQSYVSDSTVIYDNSEPEEVWYNHYGMSDIRTMLNGEESLAFHFTSSEREMLMDSSVATTDTKNGVDYKTVDKIYLPSTGTADYMDGVNQFFVGSATDDSPFGALSFSSEYWLPNNENFYSRSPRNTIGYHVLTAKYFKGLPEVGTTPVSDKNNTVAVIQLSLDTVDHFEADSDEEAFRVVYEGESPIEPADFGKVIINDAGNAIDIREISAPVTLKVVKNGVTYSKEILSDISYPLNLLSFNGTYIDSLDGAVVYIEKDGEKIFAREREGEEYNNLLITDIEGAVIHVEDNNHVPNNESEGPARFALDNDRATFYHTEWNPQFVVSETNPALITIEFNEVMNDIHQMAYLPRQDNAKGDFARFEIRYKMEESQDWVTAKEVVFENDPSNLEMLFASFDPIDAKYIQLYITEGSDSHAAAAEIDFFRKTDDKFSKLDKVISNAETFLNDSEKYTEESMTAIRMALEKAKEIRDNPNTSTDEIENAALDLANAINMVEPVNLAELKRLYEEASAMQNNNYTSITWNALKVSLSEAQKIIIGSGKTYDKVENAIQAIQSAIDGLRYHLDLEELQTLVVECSKMVEGDYEEDGWNDFTEALQEANEILTSSEQITQEEVDTAKTVLQNAKDSLKAKFDKSELRTLIGRCDEYKFYDTRFTKEAYDNLEKVLQEAKTVERDINTTQKLINQVVSKLKEAEEYLLKNRIPDDIDDILEEELNKVERVLSVSENEALYTNSTWTRLRNVWKEAREFFDGLEITEFPMRELFAYYTDLVNAYENLESRADLTVLNEWILECESLKEGDYTVGSYQALSAVLTEAKKLVENSEDVGEAAAQEMLKKLAEAKEDLVSVRRLKDLIEDISKLSEEMYTEESWTILQAVLDEADILLQDSGATKEMVGQMTDRINQAIARLMYRPADYSRVDEAIKKVEALHKEDYKDFSGVEAAIAKVVRGKNITEQDQVDAMAKTIEEALRGLEKKEKLTNSNAEDNKKEENSVKGNGTKTPATGDEMYMLLWALLIAFGGIGVNLVEFWKRSVEKK